MNLFTIIQMFLLFGHHYGNAFQGIPEAPMLPDLDYTDLPEFIRSMLPEKSTNINGNDITEDKKNKIEKSHPRTYGMSLKGDNGVVWNDLVAPKSRYQIGNSKSLPAQDIDDVIDNLINQITAHSTTPKADELSSTADHYTKPTEPTTQKATTEHNIHSTQPTTPNEKPTTKDFVRTTPKPKTQEELLKEIEEKLDSIMTDAAQYIKFPHVSKISEESKDKPSDTENKDKENNDVYDGRNKDSADIKDKIKDKKANKTQKPVNIENILELLLKNDDIWSWLSKNIAKYLEILMDRMGVAVQEEVKQLLQTHFENNPCAGCQTDTSQTENNTTTPEEDVNIEDVDIEDDNIDIKNPNGTTEELPTNHKDKPSESRKPEKQNKCDKSIIYGNSVGNEKVTNVFIFNMNSEGKPTIHYNNDSHIIDFNNTSNVNEGDKTHSEGTPTTTESTEKEANDSDVATESDADSNITEALETSLDVTDSTEESNTDDDVTGTTEAPETSDDVTNTAENTSTDSSEKSEDSSKDSESNKEQDENSNETATESENIDDDTEDASEES